jgi:hypothetical protein
MIILALLLMLSLIGINSVMTSTTEVDSAVYEISCVSSFYAAEAGLVKAASEIAASFRGTGAAPSPLPSGAITFGDYVVEYKTNQLGATVTRDLVRGAYRGLYGLATQYEITSSAHRTGTSTEVTVDQVIEFDLVPLFQFAVFYQEDLDISPGSAMTIAGRVHTNGDLYLQSGNSLNISSYVTAAGNIYHGPKPGSGQRAANGTVNIKNADGYYRNMLNRGSWLDATDSDWVAESITRWAGRVEDKDHGITDLDLSVVSCGKPRNMIATAAESADSYENKATIRIIDGVAYYQQADGSWINVTADLLADGSLSISAFYDAHQQRIVDSWDIDMSNFKDSPYFPRNGIMYTANTAGGGNLKATRLTDCSDIGAKFTLASKNSVYIQGDYNTVNKHASAILTDALTMLSNSWEDSKSSQSLSNRVASETTVNCCYMTGNQNTGSGGSAYNGGYENLPRFLENWTDVKFNWRGSAVNVWLSEEAIQPWLYGGYYTAPNRNWEFDEDLRDINKLPPGTPLISIFQKVSWTEAFAQN